MHGSMNVKKNPLSTVLFSCCYYNHKITL